uniref:Uncharacterized protein n=1 Tax=uncultured prokaryote TaxID=198431 RepID=A0A0H5Q6V7_9ZZZZ|nr:hypothetical protein [uncultured prokaryote]
MGDAMWDPTQGQLFPMRRLSLPDTPEVALLCKILDDPEVDNETKQRIHRKLGRIWLEHNILY